MREIRIRTESKIQLVDVTEGVNKAVAAIGAKNGLCNLYVPHTTAAIIVSENWDPDVTGDLLKRLEHLVPRDAGYRHGEGNSQAHILSVMLGTSLNIPVRNSALALGRWQGVMYAEFDGPRDRSLVVTLVPVSEG